MRVARTALDLADADGLPRMLTVADVVAVARFREPVVPLVEDAAAQRPLEQRMAASAEWVRSEVHAERTGPPRAVYGINTGFGALAGREAFATPYHARVLSRNLLASHASGWGAPLDEDIVRATLLIRVHQLAQGRSGIRIEVVNRLLALLNHELYPQVPEGGSLGASGDLAPLAHLGLVISRAPASDAGDHSSNDTDAPRQLPMDQRSPEVWVRDDGPQTDRIGRDFATGDTLRWRSVDAAAALEPLGGQVVLEGKEGLALLNGATVSAALLALVVADAERILTHAEIAVALTLEAIRGFRDAFLPEVHAARPHPGAVETAARILRYVNNSTLLDPASRSTDPARVPPQDPYSVRCAPQVIGAGRDAVAAARRTAEIEINAAVDNPLLFLSLPRAYKAVSCGNFHGAPLGYALDSLKVALADSASMSERRTFKLTDYKFADAARAGLSLPSFLIASETGMEGLNSGLMIPQYTAAALVSAMKTLAHPDSVDSIPSSANQEDHVSMSMNAGLHARAIADRAEAVVAIELLTAAQALEFRHADGRPGDGTAAAHAVIREAVPELDHDRALAADIQSIVKLMRSGAILMAISRALDPRTENEA